MVWSLRTSGFSWVNAAYGMVPARLSADPTGEMPKLLTGLFIHDGTGHLFWNLVFLWLFGRRLERVLSDFRFIVFFLLTGVISSLSQFAIDPLSSIPLVGSSGAIGGLLGGTLVLFPKERITVFQWPAYGMIGAWFALNILGGFASLRTGDTDTAFFAHIGGFAAGLLLIRLFAQQESKTGSAGGYSTKARVVQKPIFQKDDAGPFWRT